MKYLVNGQQTDDAIKAAEAFLSTGIAGHDVFKRWNKNGATEIGMSTLVADLLATAKAGAA